MTHYSGNKHSGTKGSMPNVSKKFVKRGENRHFSFRRRDITDLVFLEVCNQLEDQAAERAVWLDDWTEDLVSRTIPLGLSDPCEFLESYWRAESLSKYPHVIRGVDRESRAVTAFYDSEQRCKTANQRLAFLPNDYCTTSKIVRRARRELKWLLSGITPEEVMQRAHWGPGASTSLSRSRSSPQNKWEFGAHCTEGLLPWIHTLGRWSGRDFAARPVLGNLVTTVPKNAKTNRIIAIEPDWNSFIQLGLGSAIRSRLQRVGLLLDTAQAENRSLALQGSETGEYATIDLKAASDTVSLGLCDLLLPPPPDLLTGIIAVTRSDKGLVGDDVVEYEKVSSMGNGYTFELETALFYALARACSPSGVVRVYGDDVIMPAARAPLFIEVLNDLGMEVNLKKTFYTGDFRESCGGHYFRGNDVTPPYFREAVCDVPSYIRAYNKLVTAFGRCETSEFIRSKIPRYLWGPAHRGDTVLRSAWDETSPQWSKDYQAWRLVECVTTRKTAAAPEQGALLHALWGSSHVSRYPTSEKVIKLQKYTSDAWDFPY
jgi:hypothetical protein